MTEDEITEATTTHDATPSWSGYTYQGKIAIFHALSILHEKFSQDAKSCFDDYCLEIEWEQDFSIKNGSFYDSIHQVKAYSNPIYSKLKSAIIDPKGKKCLKNSLENNPDSIGYIHVWQQIMLSSSEKCVDYKEDLFQIYLGEDSELLSRIFIYPYPNGNAFCDLQDIEDLIETEINAILNLSDIFSTIPKTSEQYKRARLALYALIDAKVAFAHKTYKKTNTSCNCKIDFNTIIAKLNEAYDKLSEELYWTDLKDFFIMRVAEFCGDSSYCRLDPCDESCSIKEIIIRLEEMDQDKFANYIHEISPHKDFNQRNVFDTTLSPSDLKLSLLKAYLRLQNLTSNGFKFFITPENLTLMPTTIGDNPDEKRSIAKSILQNSSIENLKTLYEADCLISSLVNIENLKDEAIDPKSVSVAKVDRMFEKFKDRDKAFHIKKLKVKSLDKIMEEIE